MRALRCAAVAAVLLLLGVSTVLSQSRMKEEVKYQPLEINGIQHFLRSVSMSPHAWIIMFDSERCPQSAQFRPIYNKVAEKMESQETKVRFARVNYHLGAVGKKKHPDAPVSDNEHVANTFKVRAPFPIVKIMNHVNDENHHDDLAIIWKMPSVNLTQLFATKQDPECDASKLEDGKRCKVVMDHNVITEKMISEGDFEKLVNRAIAELPRDHPTNSAHVVPSKRKLGFAQKKFGTDSQATYTGDAGKKDEL